MGAKVVGEYLKKSYPYIHESHTVALMELYAHARYHGYAQRFFPEALDEDLNASTTASLTSTHGETKPRAMVELPRLGFLPDEVVAVDLD